MILSIFHKKSHTHYLHFTYTPPTLFQYKNPNQALQNREMTAIEDRPEESLPYSFHLFFSIMPTKFSREFSAKNRS